MKTFLCLILIVCVAGCTVRGGWPRFLRWGESPGWNGPRPAKSKPAAQPSAPAFLVEMAQKRDGTNYIGLYLGMIAEHDGKGGVMMYSATSGQCLKWISYQDFIEIFILKTKPEYP